VPHGATRIKGKLAALGVAGEARSVLIFLRDWFLEHVLTLDKKFAADVVAMKKDKGDRPLGS
jgi:hemerythrin